MNAIPKDSVADWLWWLTSHFSSPSFLSASGVSRDGESSTDKGRKGFALVELLVGVSILAVIFLIAFSFLMYQSRIAAASYKKSGGHEAVAMALQLLQRDVTRAQNALAANPELAFFVTDLRNNAYHQLFLNYSRFLDPHYNPTAPNVFTTPGFRLRAEVPGGAFVINALSNPERLENLANIGFVIVASDPFVPGNVQARITTGAPGGAGNFPATFALVDDAGLPANFRLVPAIGYRREEVADPVAPATRYGVLRRYGQNIQDNNNVGQKIIGGDIPETASPGAQISQLPTLIINDFTVRCLFVDWDGVALKWAPNEKAFTDLPAANLRFLEIGINYSTLEPGTGGANMVTVQATKLLRISPRLTVLNVPR